MSDINISGVSKSFGPVRALQDIALRIPHGTILALLGPSGCGKTTLLRLLAGFDAPDAGEIRFGEELVASSSRVVPPERRGIGYVPQEGTLFPHLTVAGNVRFGLSRRSDRDQRIREVLALTSMSEFADRYPHELSGGQQQRVALARALAPRPRLVLLDEPFNALDLDLRRSMCAEVTDLLRQAGTTTILVTHDPSEAFAAADEIAVMRSGHIMQCARPEAVYWHPTNPEVARLTGATIMLEGHFEQGAVAACCLGRLRLPEGSAVPATGRATVMVRPEQVRWADSGEGVPARIVRRAFHGDHTHLGVELPDTCLDLTMPSLEAPDMDARGVVRILGTCMAYPAEPGAAQSIEVAPAETATVLHGLAAA